MTILGCPCLNILIHIDKVTGEEEGMKRVQLTLDGINVQQHFLVHEAKQGDWTIVKCKVGLLGIFTEFISYTLLFCTFYGFMVFVLEYFAFLPVRWY